jgi:hypothetical protein
MNKFDPYSQVPHHVTPEYYGTAFKYRIGSMVNRISKATIPTKSSKGNRESKKVNMRLIFSLHLKRASKRDRVLSLLLDVVVISYLIGDILSIQFPFNLRRTLACFGLILKLLYRLLFDLILVCCHMHYIHATSYLSNQFLILK